MAYRFILEPYKGVSTRHICPNCHRKSCFARYIDTDKQIRFPDYVGRCNHEQKCGYNYTPKMYFEENPDVKERLNDEYRPVAKPIKVEPPPPSFIEPKMMQLSMNHYEKNNLYQFLKTNIGRSAASELMQRYNVGSSKHWTGATVFWQVDISGRIRTGKVMLYNPENGRRIKESHNYITWVHSLLKKEKFNLKQCLFGEHLLPSDSHRTVALVESEKSALIASHFLPQYLWIATGGKNGAFNREAISVLKNRQVLLFPDLGATDYWRGKMEMMQRLGIEVSLFDFMENNATDEERNAGYDIADFLLKATSKREQREFTHYAEQEWVRENKAETKESVLSRMIAKNPHLETLISTLDLEVVSIKKHS